VKSAPVFNNPFQELKFPEQSAPAPDVAADKKAAEKEKEKQEEAAKVGLA